MYTSQEIQDTVEKLVLSSVTTNYDTLGVRRSDLTFSEIQQAAAGVFLLYFPAPYYTAFLGAQKLLELSRAEGALVETLTTAIISTGRTVLPVKDLTSLANARAALFSLEGAVTQRTQGFSDITKVPAFQRFSSNTADFLSQTGPAVKQGGDIVPTPQEARVQLPSLVAQLKASHEELVRRASLLQNALSDFNSLNLPSLVAAGVISRARQLLDARINELEGLSETQRLTVIRGVILDVLASRGLVEKFGSLASFGPFYVLEGTGRPYTDSQHLGVAASLTSELAGPYGIWLKTQELDLFLNTPTSARFIDTATSVTVPAGTNNTIQLNGAFPGGSIAGDVVYVLSGSNQGTRWTVSTASPTTIVAAGNQQPIAGGAATFEVWRRPEAALSIAPSFVAFIDGTATEPYAITLANNQMKVLALGITFTITLPLGAAVTAAQVASAANAVFGLAQVKMSPIFSPMKYQGPLDISSLGGSNARFSIAFGTFSAGLGIASGDLIEVLTGPNAGLWVIFAITTTHLDAALQPAVPETGRAVTVGSPLRKLRLELTDPPTALANRRSIQILSTPTVAQQGAATVGFAPGITSTSRPSSAKEVAQSLNDQTTLADFSTSFDPSTIENAPARTEPFVSNLVIFTLLQTSGTTTAGTFATVTLDSLTGVQNGQILAIRNSTGNPADIGKAGPITAVNTTLGTVSVTFNSPVSAGAVDVEVGPDLVGINEGYVVQVLSGPNQGDFYVQGQNPVIPFELTLDAPLPLFNVRNQPVTFQASVGGEHVVMASANRTTSSYILSNGPASDVEFFINPAPFAYGTTPWFQLPEVPKGLVRGDRLELYTTQYNDPSLDQEILGIEASLKLVQVTSVPSELLPIPFSLEVPVPFGRIRRGESLDYSSFSSALGAWLAAAPQQTDQFFTDFNRFINPLISNTNPTDAQVQDAKNKLESLSNLLLIEGSSSPALTLEQALLDYEVDPVPSVDTLLKSFRDKGADRAADVLVEGQFTSFFGLDVHGSSYAGAMLGALRDVARNDLPMRKVGRTDTQNPRLLASGESPDYETDQTDVKPDQALPDPPVTVVDWTGEQ